jgi:hypothetical protein
VEGPLYRCRVAALVVGQEPPMNEGADLGFVQGNGDAAQALPAAAPTGARGL